MMITNVRYGRVAFMGIALLLVVLMYITTQFGAGGGFFGRVGKHFHHWFQETVFQLNWEEMNCIKRQENDTNFDEKWIAPVAEQLNLKDGHSIFDSNTRCNDWLQALRKKYPGMTVGGADFDPEAVGFAKRFFNSTPGRFGLARKGKLDFVDTVSYDHAFNFGGLRKMNILADKCSLVRELLRIVKPGGSVYLGHNMEEDECLTAGRYHTLPGCYWSDMCLANRTDVAEIYYIKEKDLFGNHPAVEDCFSAVFIHKSKRINKVIGDAGEIKAKYTPHPKMYHCKVGTQKNADKLTPDAGTGVLFDHKSLGQALRKHKAISESKKNESE